MPRSAPKVHARSPTRRAGLGPHVAAPRTLRDYGFIADGERGAVVRSDGAMVWLCFPSWADPAVLCSLLGGAGAYTIEPEGWYVATGSYEPGTLIWRTRWTAAGTARLESRDALVAPGTPGDALIVRRLTAVHGDWHARAGLHLAGNYGRQRARNLKQHDGAWTGTTAGVHFRWSGMEQAMAERDGSMSADIRLHAGESIELLLELSTTPIRYEVPRADELWDRIEATWRMWVPPLDNTIAERDARHSYAVLRGLTSPASGALAAAATTSLPERADAARDYDYRYAWIRDQALGGQAMVALGGTSLLDDTVRFISERLLSDGSRLAPVYTTKGERIQDQEELDLPGYPGAPLVVYGNRAGKQFQLDIFGEALLLFGGAAAIDRLNDEGRQAAEIAARAIEQRWNEPDCGIWETEPRWWTHSRLVCAAGLRRMAAGMSPGPLSGSWLALADSLVAQAAKRCSHPTGRWQRSSDDERIDAALLVAQVRGAVPVADPRSRLTREAVQNELGLDGFVYRYRKQGQPLGEAEGAFLLCNFWMALACAQAGLMTEASTWFERARSACGPSSLFCEEYDVTQRQLRGNLPQAFVHALLIESAAVLAQTAEGKGAQFD